MLDVRRIKKKQMNHVKMKNLTLT